jgi:hypothetical protein
VEVPACARFVGRPVILRVNKPIVCITSGRAVHGWYIVDTGPGREERSLIQGIFLSLTACEERQAVYRKSVRLCIAYLHTHEDS